MYAHIQPELRHVLAAATNRRNQNLNFLYYTRRRTNQGVASWRSPSPQLVPRYTVQECIGGNLR